MKYIGFLNLGLIYYLTFLILNSLFIFKMCILCVYFQITTRTALVFPYTSHACRKYFGYPS